MAPRPSSRAKNLTDADYNKLSGGTRIESCPSGRKENATNENEPIDDKRHRRQQDNLWYNKGSYNSDRSDKYDIRAAVAWAYQQHGCPVLRTDQLGAPTRHAYLLRVPICLALHFVKQRVSGRCELRQCPTRRSWIACCEGHLAALRWSTNSASIQGIWQWRKQSGNK